MLEHLPPEILHTIFSQLPPWTLPLPSLVCRRWQSLIFPLLYRTLFFNRYDSANQLAGRINGETKTSPLRISICVRNLLVDLDPGSIIHDDDKFGDDSHVRLHDAHGVELAIFKLKALKNVYWGPQWLLVRPKTLFKVQEHTSLQSVELRIEINQLTESNAPHIFRLENLKEISIDISRTLSWGEEVRAGEKDIPNLLISMLRASPNLESLCLSFWSDVLSQNSTASWNPKVVFSSLAADYFACLRVLRILSDKWFFSACPDVQSFLRKHPQLHTIDFHWIDRGAPQTMTTGEIAAAVPSVRNFEGPVLLVRALLRSGLSAQIENLIIYGNTSMDLATDITTQDLSHDIPTLLPCLRRLHVRFNADVKHLVNLVKAAPMLEELGVVCDVGFYISGSEYSEQYMKILELAPRLRILEFWEDVAEQTDGTDGPAIEPNAASVKRVIKRAVSLCPRLNAIHHMKESRFGTWDIRRIENEEIALHYFYRSQLNLFPGVELPQTARGHNNPWARRSQWYDGLVSV